jgi:hypothetical protein
LVNPWVSRMNSSANQISPIGHRRETLSRVAKISPNLAGCPRRLTKSRLGKSRPRPAASGREYAVNATV